MATLIYYTGCTHKSTTTALYEINKKNIHSKKINKKNKLNNLKFIFFIYVCMFFFTFLICGLLKIPCVPCADNTINISIEEVSNK